jgi:hypothetical protein
MGFTAFGSPIVVQATTGLAGFALQNATPNILTWTPPNDGNMHRLLLIPVLVVTNAQTGGAVTYSYFTPNGQQQTHTLWAGGLAVSTPLPTNLVVVTIAPGQPVVLAQSSAQTAGAASVWAEIWGS